MKKYCTSCGKANNYTLEVPKKCEFCGHSFGQSQYATQKITNSQKTIQSSLDQEEYFDDDVRQNIKINASRQRNPLMSFQLEGNEYRNGMSIDDVIKDSDE